MTTYYQQATTGKLHATKGCSITSRTRYNHFELELTDAEAAKYPKCDKCFGSTMPTAPARKATTTPIEEAFPIGSRVRQSGYGVSFEVVGYWRGYAKLAYNGTTHSAPASDLTLEAPGMTVGTRISYTDQANPYREGTVLELIAGEYRVAWDEGGEAISDCRQAGWKVLPAPASTPAGLAFARKLRNLEGMYRRLDSGELTGRNSSSSDGTRDMRYAELETLAGLAVVAAMLDADDRLAARWNRLERRHAGLAS